MNWPVTQQSLGCPPDEVKKGGLTRPKRKRSFLKLARKIAGPDEIAEAKRDRAFKRRAYQGPGPS